MHEERVTGASAPAIVAEHVARYALAQPVASATGCWVDLGAGTGLPASIAFGAAPPGRVLLVDASAPALEEARERFAAVETTVLQADLSATDDLERIAHAVRQLPGEACVTCFEVIEHLPHFAPLVELLLELARADRATIVLSAPNDAFTGVDNEHHLTQWGASSVEELRSFLPREHLVLDQAALVGSAIAPRGHSGTHAVSIALDGAAVPSHTVVAFGPRAEGLAPSIRVVQHDASMQRAWERQRDADLAWFRQRVSDLEHYEAELEAARAELARRDAAATVAPPDVEAPEDGPPADA